MFQSNRISAYEWAQSQNIVFIKSKEANTEVPWTCIFPLRWPHGPSPAGDVVVWKSLLNCPTSYVMYDLSKYFLDDFIGF